MRGLRLSGFGHDVEYMMSGPGVSAIYFTPGTAFSSNFDK